MSAAPDVAIVVPALAGGGAQRANLTLAELLHRRGHRVELVLFRRHGALASEVPPGVAVVDLGVRRALFALPKLIAYLRRRRPRALLACLDRTIVVAVVAAGLARTGARVVGQVHNTLSKTAAGSRKWQDRVAPSLARVFYPRCNAIVAVSEGVAEDLVDAVGLPAGLVETIYNPVPIDGIATSAAQPPAHPWFCDGGPPVVLGIGRLTKQKDFPTLVRAFARLRRSVDARLVVLGEGEDRDLLERLVVQEGVSRDVDLPGYVDDPAPFLGAASVFALSSAWEGFGLVVVEALAAGTPVVSTDCPNGPREILDGGRYGRLVPVGDPDALAGAILASLEHRPDPALLRARARDFAPETVLPAYIRVLELEP